MRSFVSTLLALIATRGFAAENKVDFNYDIRPIISAKCFHCHGPDEKSREAKLRLDVRADALKEHDEVRAIVPGNVAASELITRALSKDSDEVMPPPKEGHALTAGEIALLEKWIEQGAEYKEHWAWSRPVRPAVPALSELHLLDASWRNAANGFGDWSANPIDTFVLQKLAAAKLMPSPEAPPEILLRRLTLDLVGLPPTPAEVDEFVKAWNAESSSSGHRTTIGSAVDRLLASPAFGEKWARMWLDLARYADSTGYGSDKFRLNIWPYRDWVIDAFNRNLPFDQFTTEQLAGDLLPNATTEQIVATAFHRNTMTNVEGGTIDEEYRVAAVKDRIATTGQVWMGLTVGCAQCHSHKFDPIPQKEYYQFFGVFNETEDSDREDEEPKLPLPTADQLAKTAALKTAIEELERSVKPMTGNESEEEITRAQLVPNREDLAKQLVARRAELAAIKPVQLPVMRELGAAKQRETHLLTKGNYLAPAEKLEPGLLSAFAAFMPANAPADRLTVARWIVHPENPLTARVAVNRFWAQLFGVGIVETEEDFGTQGALPSHPELLDWLAVTFQSHPGAGADFALGWDMKALLKLIVTSATYRQSSRVTPEALEKDARNRLLSHAPRRRLEAEAVRDQALALSGLLSRKMGGPSVYPPQPDGLWKVAFNGGQNAYPTSKGEDRYRRGIYTFWRRTMPPPSMATFDAPSRESCTVRRISTNTPLQAFVTLNDPVFVECAQALGRRIMREGGADTDARIRYALKLCLARPPEDAQIQALASLYESELADDRAAELSALKLATEPIGPLPENTSAPELAAWTVVANVLLNLDGVLTKN